MRYIISTIRVILFLIVTSSAIYAQQTLNIGIIEDANTIEFKELSDQLKTEITNLIASKFDVSFQELNANADTLLSKNYIHDLMNDPDIDYVITLGYVSSQQISELKHFSKPVIAATIFDDQLQKLPLKAGNNTGISNFTYIESIVNLKTNLIAFSSIYDTKDIAVIIPKIFKDNFPQLDEFFVNNNAGFNISIITVNDSSYDALSKITDNIDAAIVLPMIGFSQTEIQKLFTGLNKRHIPSLAVSGLHYLDLGATITMTPEFTFQQLSRQIALRIMKISEGMNPSQIPVDIDYKKISIINMESVRATDRFPEWNVLNESILINVASFSNGENINLRMTISEALKNNLQGKMALNDIEIADKEIRIARSNLLPQVGVGGSAVVLSNNLVEASMGQRGEFTLTGSASLKQVIYSESAFANLAINKLMAKNKRFYNDQTVLDIVLNTSSLYIGLLFSKSNLLIQNENVNTTKKNLEMAKTKEEAGQTGISDVNRWVSELNMNKMKFNDAYATYRSSMYQINKQLNNEINVALNIGDSNNIDKTILIDKELLKQIFENPVLTEQYAGFIIEEMKVNSPELQQLLAMTEIIDRQRKLYQRQWFLPELVAFGGADQAFIREGTIPPPDMPIPPPPDDMTFNFGLSLNIPILQGGKSSAQAKKTMIELDKINSQKEELNNKLETAIRSGVQKLRTSYLELELSKNAAEAAEANFKMVQGAYFQGAVDLIQLIDAQNVMLKTKYMANISYYQFIIDYINVERYQGSFTFLSSVEDREYYTKRLNNYLVKQ